MLIGLDHVIVAVPDPDAAAARLEDELGVAFGLGGRHAAYGSFNRLAWLGDSYIELLGITDRSLAASTWFGPRALEMLDRQGGGYVGLAIAVDNLAAEIPVLRDQGTALGEPASGERVRPDGGVVRWWAAVAPQADPELGTLFLIEHDTAAAEWRPAERAERAARPHPLGGPVRLDRVELPVADLRSATMRLHRDLGVAFRPALAGGGARDGAVGRQTLRLLRSVPGAGGQPRVVLRGGSTPAAAEIFGTGWVVEPAG